MRIIELFAGIGACSKALENIGIDLEIVDAVEIDKYAIKSFNAIHGTNFEPQDITKWDKDFKDIDIITHGSPCQDFSVAGKQAGGDKDSGTRSSLMYETVRIVEKIKPKYVLWENVKNLLSKAHKHNFDNYIETMDNLGYNSYYRVLNAKDYGVPQNRERVYTISIRKDIDKGYKFEKGIENNNVVINPLKDKTEYSWQFEQAVFDENGLARALKAGGGSGNIPKVVQGFTFPIKEELKIRLKDVLEENVDEKYYLSNIQLESIKNSSYIQNQRRIQEKEYCDTLCARDWKDPKCVRIGGIFDTENSKHQAGSIYDKEGISPTLDVMQGGWRQPSIVEDTKCIQVGTLDMKGIDQLKRVYSPKGLCPTITTMGGGNTEPKIITNEIVQKVRVRKYLVNTDKLSTLLSNRKSELGITCKEIAEELNLPLTQVEHYFRKDSSFAIPDENIWFKLKRVLQIRTKEFDESIMTFEERDGVYEKANRVYDTNGLAPTLTQQEEKIIENTTLKTKLCNELIEKGIVKGGEIINHSYTNSEQRNTLDKYIETDNGIVPTLTTRADILGYTENINQNIRIRKLTPKECWRLMSFDDESFEKAQNVPTSNSQLYKQAGNSIVVKVLEKIFKNLFEA